MSKFIISGFSDEISSDFETQLRAIKKMNIAYIEIRGVNGKNISELSINEVLEVKKQLKANNIKISAIGSPIGKIEMTDDFEAHMDVFKHLVEIAEILETPNIRMFSFFMKSDDVSKNEKEVFRRLKVFKDHIRDKNIVLLHENEKDIYGDVPERCLKIYKAFGDDQFKLIFDPANFIQCGVDVLKAYNMLKPYIHYFHIKDATKTGKVVPAGEGVGELREIISDLHASDYEGFLSVEPHLGQFEGLNQLESGLTLEEKSDEGKFRLAVGSLRKIIEEVCHD